MTYGRLSNCVSCSRADFSVRPVPVFAVIPFAGDDGNPRCCCPIVNSTTGELHSSCLAIYSLLIRRMVAVVQNLALATIPWSTRSTIFRRH